MKKAVFLFDLDGVIFDTEGQYTEFWDGIGSEYLGDPHLAEKLKGETITQSLRRCFPDDVLRREEVRKKLYDFEAGMKFCYVPGAYEFLSYLKENHFPAAIVTSSNRDKMAQVYKVARSKPFPDCYLMGMDVFGAVPDEAYIFEDSFNGLRAGRDSGGHVIALATTNSRESVAPYSDLVLDDFRSASESLSANFGLFL